MEVTTMLFYDVENDRIRGKIADTCLDYGLERIQYSVFRGRLTRNMREEIFLRVSDLLADTRGSVVVVPICEKDIACLERFESKIPRAKEEIDPFDELQRERE